MEGLEECLSWANSKEEWLSWVRGKLLCSEPDASPDHSATYRHRRFPFERSEYMEEWLSGRKHRFRKPAGVKAPRGFESHLFRNDCQIDSNLSLSILKDRNPLKEGPMYEYEGSIQAEIDKLVLSTLELHCHPTSNTPMWGRRLIAGEVIQESDCLGSPEDEDWISAGVVYAGKIIREGCYFLWVRPCSIM